MQTNRRTARAARRLFRLCVVDGMLDENRVRRVVQGGVSVKRRGGLAILSRFVHLVRLDRVRHSARVESAVPLEAELRAQVERGVTQTYGQGLTTSFVVNPALIGGMRIRVGSDIYDGSVRARLDSIDARL